MFEFVLFGGEIAVVDGETPSPTKSSSVSNTLAAPVEERAMLDTSRLGSDTSNEPRDDMMLCSAQGLENEAYLSQIRLAWRR